MHFVMRRCVIGFLISCFATEIAAAENGKAPELSGYAPASRYGIPKDTTGKKLSEREKNDSIRKTRIPVDTNAVKFGSFRNNSIDVNKAAIYPYSSLQQMLKGEVAGVYIQEPSGEPGTEMGMMIRGTAIPLTSHKDVYDAQPLVVLDGIPLIMDHPFAFDIQQYDYNRIGPATNLLSAIDPNNIASIEVLKDYAAAAIYGPRAANGGVIAIRTKAPVIGGRKIAFNTWFGMAQKPHTYTTNARYENDFRQPYYNRYASLDNILTYPAYLRDSTNQAYYGPANWTDLYYANQLIRGVNASLSSGSERANFRFAAGNEQIKN
ncbi:TonB-dependent receptor plug domain-containing protein, partial [Chitinophaga sp.]|uniref:TonB-dependent receptor plug domain-containing protein n=1 Tax=Chitinophaga sp. TaxID=1869181 RepID=UPI002F950253